MTTAMPGYSGDLVAAATESPQPPPQQMQPMHLQANPRASSIVQLAAASLGSSSDSTQQQQQLRQRASLELKRSQKLKKEIDRLKSSIPLNATCNLSAGCQAQREINNSNSRGSNSHNSHNSQKPTSCRQKQRGAFSTAARENCTAAPLASLDYTSIITTSSQVDHHQQKQQAQNTRNASSTASSSAEDTPTLSGYFDCDELSDMIDDSLFELTNAGCLSRSIFPRDQKIATTVNHHHHHHHNHHHHHDQRKSERNEPEDDDGERTPTNQPEVERATIGADHVLGAQSSSGPKAMAFQAPVSMHRQGHDFSSTGRVPNSLAAANNRLASSSSSSSSTSSQSSPSTSSSPSLGQPDNSKLAARTSEKIKVARSSGCELSAQRSSQAPTSTASASAAAAAATAKVSGRRKVRTAAAATTTTPATASSAITSQLGCGETLVGDRGGTHLRSAAHNRRASSKGAHASAGRKAPPRGHLATSAVPEEGATEAGECHLCREQANRATQGASHKSKKTPKGNNKKSGGGGGGGERTKRRFTFSLFNLFTGGGRAEEDNDDKPTPATCQHHRVAAQALPIESRSEREVGGAVSAPAAKRSSASAGGGKRHSSGQFAAQPKRALASANVAANQDKSADCSLLPLRLRDSIKITNQRKMRRQTNSANNSNGSGSGSGSGSNGHGSLRSINRTSSSINRNQTCLANKSHAPDTELLLDLSTNQRSQAPAPAKSKCVKFTTPPDRVLIVSPTPQVDTFSHGGYLPASGNRKTRDRQRVVSSSASMMSLSSAAAVMPSPLLPPPPPNVSPASIIKRTSVPKSSSYSQTERNKGLDELLARYEQDNTLVAEINEKLRLTETIASNRVACDSSLEKDSGDEVELERQQQQHQSSAGDAAAGRKDSKEDKRSPPQSSSGRSDFECNSDGGDNLRSCGDQIKSSSVSSTSDARDWSKLISSDLSEGGGGDGGRMTQRKEARLTSDADVGAASSNSASDLNAEEAEDNHQIIYGDDQAKVFSASTSGGTARARPPSLAGAPNYGQLAGSLDHNQRSQQQRQQQLLQQKRKHRHSAGGGGGVALAVATEASDDDTSDLNDEAAAGFSRDWLSGKQARAVLSEGHAHKV